MAMSEKEKKELEKALEEKKRKSAEATYTNEYKKAVDETFRYANMSSKNLQEVADTLATGMIKRKPGDLDTWDWDVEKQTVKDQASAIKAARKYGLFDREQYAVNPGTVAMVSDDYLKALAENLPGRITLAQEADAQAKQRKEQTAETQARWAELFKAKDTENEFDQWYNYLMADYLLGDREVPFDFEKINAKYDAMDDATYYAEEKRLKDQFENLDWTALTGSSTNPHEGMTDTYSGYIKTVNREIKRRDNLEAMQGQIRANADYAEMSAYTGKQLDEPDRLINGGLQNREDIGKISDLYSFMNIDATHDVKEAASKHLGAVNMYLNEGYDMLTSDELADYNYLYNAGRMEEAAEYLELLRPDLLSRRAKVNQAYTEAKATADAVNAGISWLEARGNKLGSKLMVPFQAYETAMGRDDPYSAIFDTNNKADWVQEAHLGYIDDSDMADWLKAVLSYTYTGVTSAADNGVQLLASCGNPTVALIGAGLSSVSSSLHESSQRDDMSAAAKIVKAIAAGALEMGTEKIGLDALFDMGQANALNYIKGLIASELGEETINYLGEDVLEMAVGFLFDYEPEIKSGEEFWKGLTDTWITTAISAGMMGTPGAMSIRGRNVKSGKTITSNGSVEQLLSIAESMGQTSKAAETAKEIRQKTAGGKKASLPQLGMLTFQLEQELTQKQSEITNQVMEDAIEERMVELGSDRNTAIKNKAAVRKIAFGEKLNAIEKARVKWDENASQVVKELAKPIAEGEEMRTGAEWQTKAAIENALQTRDVTKKQIDLASAFAKEKSPDVQAAQEKAKQKTEGKTDYKAKGSTSKEVTFSESGEEAKGTFLRFKKTNGGMQAVVETESGETTIEIDDMKTEGGYGTATIIEYVSSAKHNMSEAEANTLMTAYNKQGGDAGNFIDSFEEVYSAGFAGIEAQRGLLQDDVQQAVYAQAKKEGEEAEANRVAKAQRVRDAAEGTVAWLGVVRDNNAIRGTGDQEALSGALEGMTESQRTTVEVVQAFAREMKVNMVLYESDAQNVQQIANGMYDETTHTVYLDINSGAVTAEGIRKGKENNTIGYAMNMTLAHELTHHMEATSAEGYARYKAAVKERLKENGQSWTELVREKIKNASKEGRKLTRMGAEAEVVADASEYMLQDSAFTKKLDTSLKQKVQEFVQGFVEKVKEIFRTLGIGGSHRESMALREMADGLMKYIANLQQLWDAGMEDTIPAGNGTAMAQEQQDLENNKKTISGTASVSTANGNLFVNLDGTNYRRAVQEETMPVDDLPDASQFALRTSVEKREDGLMAMHNLKLDDMWGTIRLGGFPMPSIAIVKAKHGHTMYGPYSVIFGRKTIDPEADYRNRVYGADAWTPVFPTVETELLGDAMYDVQDEIAALAGQVDEEFKHRANTFFGNFSGEDSTRYSVADLLDKAWGNYGLMGAYLTDKGEKVSIEETEVEVNRGYNPKRAETYNKMIDIIGLDNLVNMGGRQLIDTYGDQLATEIRVPFARLNANWKDGDRQAGLRMIELFGQAIKYEGSGRDTSTQTTKKKDYYATATALEKQIDRADFNAWMTEKIQPFLGQQGIYNGKERFTPMGNRRTFKQTHMPLTAENVVKSMLTQQESNIPATDAHGLMAAAATRYGSVDEIRADSARLGKISDEEYRARLADADNDLRAFLNAIEAWDYDQQEEVGDLLVQAGKGKMTAARIKTLFNRHGYSISTDASKMAANLLNKVQTIPTGYFEAKPARVVGFDEVRMVVAPQDMPAELAGKLDELGIPYTTYDGTDADRLEKANAVEDVQFSRRDENLLSAQEHVRVQSAWVDYTERGYKFFERNNGGIIIDLDSAIVYTDDEGAPEYVLDVGTDDRWSNNDVFNMVIEMEKEGVSHEMQHRILKSCFGEAGARFRTRGKRAGTGRQNRAGAGRNAGGLGQGDHGQVPGQEEVSQYSIRDQTDAVSVREYLAEMTPKSYMNDTEVELLRRYQGKLKEMREKQRAVAEQEEIIKTATGEELMKATNRRKVLKNQADRLAKTVAGMESAKGFAGIMTTSRKVVDEYLNNLMDNVSDKHDSLVQEIEGLTEQLKDVDKKVEAAAQGQRNAVARGLFDQEKLKQAAKKVKADNASSMSAKVIADRLALAYAELYAQDGQQGAKNFAEKLKDLAQDIISTSGYRYRSETLRMIAEEIPTISLTETDRQEIRNAGLTVAQYKRALSPYVRVTDRGSDLGSQAGSAEYYGGVSVTALLGTDNETDMAMALYETIQREKASEGYGKFEGMTEEESIGVLMAELASADMPTTQNAQAMEYLRNEMQKYAGQNETARQMVEEALKRAKRTADRASGMWVAAVRNRELTSKAVDYYRELERQRRLMELREQKQRLEKELTSDTAKQIREKVLAQKQEANEYWSAKVNANTMRDRIARNVKRLNRMRKNETDRDHVPQELQHVADMVMKTFTEGNLAHFAFEPEQTAMLQKYYSQLLNQENDFSYYWDDEIAKSIDDMQQLSEEYAKEGIRTARSTEKYEMERAILARANDIIENVLYMIENHNRQFINGKKINFDKFAEESARQMNERKDKVVLADELGAAQQAVDELIKTGNKTPIYFFEQLENDGVMQIYNDIRDGQTRYAHIVHDAKNEVEEIKARNHYGRWMDDGKLTLTTVQGHRIELTREQALWLYATAKRERTNVMTKTEHLKAGGFHYKQALKDGIVRQTDIAHLMEAKDIAAVESWLTEEQKAYADEVVEYLSTTMGGYGNQASMEMFGYKKFNEPYYFPFQTSQMNRYLHGDEGAHGQDSGTGRVKNASYTKKLQMGAKTALVMDDFTTVAVDHMQSMAAYASMVEPIEALKRLLNYQMMREDGSIQTYRELIAQKYGKTTLDYLMNFLKDLNGAAQSDNRAMKGVDYFIRAFKRGAVSMSASVTLQQPTAIARAMAMVNPKYFLNNPFYRPGKGVWDEMLAHSGTAIIKDMGKFDVGLGLTASEYIRGEDETALQAWGKLWNQRKGRDAGDTWAQIKKAGKLTMDKANALPGLADQWTWGLIWQAVKKETAGLNPGMDTTSNEFLDMVGKRFDDVIDHTQVYDSILTKSDLMRSRNALHKMATTFMAEPTMSINMLYDAFRGKHTAKERAAMVGGVMASNILTGLAAALVQAWNNDDDERNWAEKYADRAAGNVLGNINPGNMIPYIRDIISLCEGYDVERADMTVISDLVKYTSKFMSKVQEGKELSSKDWENFAGTWANLIGVSVKNIMREIRRGKNLLYNTDWSAPDASNVGYAIKDNLWGYDSKNTAYYERIVTAMVKGDEDKTESLRTYLLTSKGVSEDALMTGLKKEIKARVVEGEMDGETALAMIDEYGMMDDENEAYFEVKKWVKAAEDGGNPTGYKKYDDFREAAESGEHLKEVIDDYLDHGVTESTLTSELRGMVIDGLVEDEKALKILVDYGLKEDKNDAYWTVQSWKYAAENGGSTEGYRKYGKLLTAVESGENLKAVIKEYTSHGVKEKTLKSEITEEYKPILIELYKTDRVKFANLQARVLTAYQALGYDRDEMLKTIQKWLKE